MAHSKYGARAPQHNILCQPITHHTTSMNYNASNANSDNINVNRTDVSKNINRVIAPERTQRTGEFDNVLRCMGNWENRPRGEYVLPCP